MFQNTTTSVKSPIWTTQDEIQYLNTIGTHTVDYDPGKSVSVARKVMLLRGALEGYSKRNRWGNLDKNKIVAHTKHLMSRYNHSSKKVSAAESVFNNPGKYLA